MIETIDRARSLTFTGPLRIDDFIAFLVRSGRAPGTIGGYRWGG